MSVPAAMKAELTTFKAAMVRAVWAGGESFCSSAFSGTENIPGGMMLITGRVPLTGLDGYANRLNALTQGAGSYTIELDAYEPVPAQLQADLASKFQRKAEED